MRVLEPLPDERDPFVLVRGAERPGDDRELSLPAQQARCLAGQGVGDAFGGRLIDEEITGVGFGVGVPCQHMDAPFAGLAQHCGDASPVLDGHGNGVHLARDPVLDELVLFRGVEARRSVPHQIDIELARRLFRADAATDKVRIALRLRHDGDHRPMWRGRRRMSVEATRAGAHRSEEPDVGAGHDQRAREDRSAKDRNLTVFHLKLLLRHRTRARAPAEVTIHGNRCNEQHTGQDTGQLGRPRREVQPGLQHREGEEAQQRPPDRAAPAEDRRAAQHHGGDRIELVTGAGVRPGLPQMRDVDDRRNARNQSRQQVDETNAPGHRNRRVTVNRQLGKPRRPSIRTGGRDVRNHQGFMVFDHTPPCKT